MQISILSHEMSWSLAWLSNLEHWIRWLKSLLTIFTKIIIWSDSTFVSDTNDRICTASITDEFLMDNFRLFFLLFLKMLDQEFLILRGTYL
jgi:hypothetical protein